MEGLVNPRADAWSGRSVFLTGHTGFKGGWLALMLHALGARVHGYALDPDSGPSMFEVAGIRHVLSSDTRADLADRGRLADAMASARPDVILHLAAQPLVRESYVRPVDTFATNVMGTVHLLDAARSLPGVRAIVVVTTDKVYANDGAGRTFAEGDALGGDDPYSASKAAAELVTASYRHSFFRTGYAAKIATARAGNVIGGGDWAVDRLVPDCMRAFAEGEAVHLRYPSASRPWQHVMEPLVGYLVLAERLFGESGMHAARAWNFGPRSEDEATVGDVAQRLALLWGDGASVRPDDGPQPHEAGLLALDSTAARELGWRPRWSLAQALDATVSWHRTWLTGGDMNEFTRTQIAAYLGAV